MTEKTITIRGCEIHYIEQAPREGGAGDGGAPRAGTAGEGGDAVVVVYVHGNLGSYRWYERVMEIPGARALALDLPNFGRSGRIPTHDIFTYGEYLASFINELVGGSVVLIGHSLGGAVAMSVACSRPALVSRMMLVDPAPVEGLVTSPDRYPAIEAWREDEAQLRPAFKAMVPTLSDDAFFDELVADARRMKGEAYIGHAKAVGEADFRDKASAYTGPVVVVRGGQDLLITDEMARRTAAAFNGSVWEYPHVGHAIMVEDPGQFIEAVSRFITEE
jgi:branched-chain amino acid transport system permease protein